MQAELVTTEKGFDNLGDVWDSLIPDGPGRIFSTFDFLRAWWEHFGEGDLRIIVAKDAKVRGIAPLFVTDGALRFIGDPLADYSCFLAKDTKTRETLVKEIGHLKCRKVVLNRISRQDLDALDFDIVSSSTGRHVDLKQPQHVRKLLRKLRTRPLLKSGELRHRERSRCQRERLDRMIAFHIGRMRKIGERSHFEDRRMKAFYTEWSKNLGHKLSFWRLVYQGKEVGYHFGLDFQDRFLFFNQSYDPDHIKLSPGTLMLTLLVEQSLKDGKKEFDLSRGDEPYKKRIANAKRSTYDAVFCRNPLCSVRYRGYFALKRFMEQHPVLYRRLRVLISGRKDGSKGQ
jgi:CelD/BcsL family acetyltransferase involved in cellulose biosynthesis